MNHSKEQWEEIGLLETTPEDRKDDATRILNVAMKYLLNEEADDTNKVNHQPFETIGIPILLKFIKEVDLSDAEVIEILKDIPRAVENYDFSKFNGFDINLEMEFAHEYYEEKIKQLKNR